MRYNSFAKMRNGFLLGVGFSAGFAVTGLFAFTLQHGFYTFQTGDSLSSSQINQNFVMVNAPVGTIVAWHKSLPGVPQDLPENWVECNGQTIDDPESLLNGQSAPDLNHPYNGLSYYSEGVFLRGHTVSGIFEEDMMQGHWHSDANHAHTLEITHQDAPDYNGLPGGPLGAITKTTSWASANVRSPSNDTAHGDPRTGFETRPVNMSVVWIMKIK